jgi:hypothetical protein
MPASFSFCSASRRRSGVAARGSIFTGQFGIKRRQRNAYGNGVVCRQLPQNVNVARDEMIFGDENDRVAKIGQHFEALPRQLETSFQRLVAVGDAAHRNHARLPAFETKFPP